METRYGVFRPFVFSTDETPAEPRRWKARQDLLEVKLQCPVSGWPQAYEGQGVRDSFNLRCHFASRYPRNKVTSDGICHHHCRLCGMQMGLRA
jgi:hypothetical protein